MRPILFELGGYPFASWYVFFALAWIVSYFVFSSLLNSVIPSQHKHAYPFFVTAYISGWLGARALGIWTEEPQLVQGGHFFSSLLTIGPMTYYGGVLAASCACCLFVFKRKLPFFVFWDAALISLPLALGIGRLGCFLNGDDFGSPIPDQFSPPWWSVRFELVDSYYRYPVQLWEAGFCFLLFTSLWFVRKHLQLRPGTLGCISLAAMATSRFWNESFRGDLRGVFPGTSLSTSQGISVILLLISVALLVMLHRPARAAH